MSTTATYVPVRFKVDMVAGDTQISGAAVMLSRVGMVANVDTSARALIKGAGQVSTRFGLANQQIDAVAKVAESRISKDHRGQAVLQLTLHFELNGRLEQMLREFVSQWRPMAMCLGFPDDQAGMMHASLSMIASTSWARTPDDIIRYLDAYEIAVLCIGPLVDGPTALTMVSQARQVYPGNTTKVVVAAQGADPAAFRELIDAGVVYYVGAADTSVDELAKVAQGAVRRRVSSVLEAAKPPPSDVDPTHLSRIVTLNEQLALQTETKSIGRLVFAALEEMVDADRAYFLVVDAAKEALWAVDGGGDMKQSPLAAGIVGFVARTASQVNVADVSSDSRFQRDVDDPQGMGSGQLVAEPVVAESWADAKSYDGSERTGLGRVATVQLHSQDVMAEKRVLAILVIVREAGKAAFSHQELTILRMVAAQVTSAFSRIDMKQALAQLAATQGLESQQRAHKIFRSEALEHYARGQSAEGEPLRLQAGWMKWVYPFLLLITICAIIFGIFGKVREYARGPAIVIVEGRTLVTAVHPATVAEVWVRPGKRVRAHDVLVSLHHDQELAEYNRITRDYEVQLAKLLRNPADRAAQQQLTTLKSRRDMARRRLKKQFLRAPHDGIVGDVRVRPSQRIKPGDILLTMQGKRARYKVVALLPGSYRPLLDKGMKLRLELAGYPRSSQKIVVATVGDGVISPAEARRYLGTSRGSNVRLGSSVFVVEAPLPGNTFTFESHKHRYYDGMYGTGEVVVRSEPLLVKLLPGLKGLWGLK